MIELSNFRITLTTEKQTLDNLKLFPDTISPEFPSTSIGPKI